MTKILKVLFSDIQNIQKCFEIRKKVFVEEQRKLTYKKQKTTESLKSIGYKEKP